ncbi:MULTISPECIES: hypothetical protein [unclassified Wenzhouxiangella]|uniref:hypothetical protein n=1 Tax=unclassified Wenzhouxiangella TaxID=2613841 RepID=UPI000E32CFF1|nr:MULTISPECIES: hypothetical protein [unclassified Wenzhouxiangella]RFF28307.1 hypothetical protein DZK25_03410 [Wenzhouxiangella sp. 15181]RFP67768.1 hypothetical protein DZK26_11225 [Wenzhouxiangella sp. 15190]
MPKNPTLSVLETGQKERTVMRSLLNLAGVPNGAGAWQVIDGPGGDVTIIDVDSDEGESRWLALRDSGQNPIALTSRRGFPADYLLRKPLSARKFLDLLEHVSSGDIPPPVSEPIEEPDRGGAPEWLRLEQSDDPEQATLAEHLRAQTWNSAVVLEVSGWPRLVIDPGSGSWYYDGAIVDMEPRMFAQPMPASAGKPVSSGDLVDEVGGAVRRPLSELKWFAGLAQSRGRLHPDLLGNVEFMLTQAPSEAMNNEHYAQLARILIRAPVDVDELHRLSGEAPEDIAAFLNACYTTGRLLVNREAKVSGF